jgi:hypothetical protein
MTQPILVLTLSLQERMELRETGSITWRKNKMTSFGGLPKMILLALEYFFTLT